MKTVLFILFAFIPVLTITAQDFALKQLEASPRHHEWVTVKSGEQNVYCFVAYPESSLKTTAVIVLHENRGLTEWVRSFADQLAAQGFLAIAPDLLSDFSGDIQKTSDFESSDKARDAIYKLNPDQITNDLLVVESYITGNQASNGKTAIIGFCWGGTQSFRFATNGSESKAVLVFYGSAPETPEEIQRIAMPVFGFYGENDERINAGISATEKLMKQSGKTYDYVVYKGAGHAYMRQGDDPAGSPENKNARNESWKRIARILSAL